jgi:hypothetical protein
MQRLASMQAAIAGVMAIVLLFLHASQIGAPPVVQAAAPPPPPPPPGYLKILVEPWAEVYVDGKYADTTPFSRALSIPEGEHRIELKNPYFARETRKVTIKRGSTATLKVALARK